MDLWFENYAKLKVRSSSHQTYEGYIKNHIKPNIGNIPIEKLTSLELQKSYQKLLTDGVNIKTVSGMHGHYSAGFTLNTYAHVTTAAQKEATDTMGNVLQRQ